MTFKCFFQHKLFHYFIILGYLSGSCRYLPRAKPSNKSLIGTFPLDLAIQLPFWKNLKCLHACPSSEAPCNSLAVVRGPAFVV